jgi:hypothetical protein
MAVASKKVKPTSVASQKPCQLQLNNSGAWKTVVHFDAADDTRSDNILQVAIYLSGVDHSARFRIATCDPLPQVLVYVDKGEWRNA